MLSAPRSQVQVDDYYPCGQERVEFDEPDYALIDTLFSLAEAHLFMQLIELRERQPDIMPPGKSCADIYRRAPGE